MTNLNLEDNLKEAIDLLRSSVKATLGPTGRNAIIGMSNNIKIVDDGATIIKALDFQKDFKNHVLELVRQASLKTDEVVGDGTTTTIILTCTLLDEALKVLAFGINPLFLVVGLKKITNFVTQKVKHFSFPISSQSEVFSLLETTMGNASKDLKNGVYQAIVKKGKHGSISIEEKQVNNNEFNVQVFEGLQFEKGYISPYFLKNPENSFISLQNAFVLITDTQINDVNQIRKILDHIKINKQSLVLIAGGYDKAVLSTLIINNLNESINVVPVKAPFFGLKQKTFLEDLAIVTCGNFLSSEIIKEECFFEVEDLGRVKNIQILKDRTNISLLPSSKVSIQRRILSLQRELEVNDGVYERDILRQRIDLLSGGIVKIYLSATTESELTYLKYKVEDGINSLNTAFQEGDIISSSNLVIHLIGIIQAWSVLNLVDDEIFAFRVFQSAFIYPFRELCFNTNTAKHFSILIDVISEKGYPFGFDFKSLKIINMKENFILDSSKMLRVIFQNSISIVSSLLLSF